MRVFRVICDWVRERRTAIRYRYHLLGCFYFLCWWVACFAVLILFTGGWYDDFLEQCKNECFDGITMFFVVFSGIASFAHTRDKVVEKRER